MVKTKANKLHVCGPKSSICCSVISAWGIVMLGLMGIFFYIRSGPLLEDLDLEEFEHKSHNASKQELDNILTEAYHKGAVNCWGAAGLYVAFFVFSVMQVFFNFKR